MGRKIIAGVVLGATLAFVLGLMVLTGGTTPASAGDSPSLQGGLEGRLRGRGTAARTVARPIIQRRGGRGGGRRPLGRIRSGRPDLVDDRVHRVGAERSRPHAQQRRVARVVPAAGLAGLGDTRPKRRIPPRPPPCSSGGSWPFPDGRRWRLGWPPSRCSARRSRTGRTTRRTGRSPGSSSPRSTNSAPQPTAGSSAGAIPAGPAARHGLPAGYQIPASADPARDARLITYALAQLGKPYVWGAAGPAAFDCSGLTMMAWAAAGFSLAHFTGDQLHEGSPVLDPAAISPVTWCWSPARTERWPIPATSASSSARAWWSRPSTPPKG